MIACNVNIHAHDEDDPGHDEHRAGSSAPWAGRNPSASPTPEPFGLAHPATRGLVGIVAHPTVLPAPLGTSSALDVVDRLWVAPAVVVLVVAFVPAGHRGGTVGACPR